MLPGGAKLAKREQEAVRIHSHVLQPNGGFYELTVGFDNLSLTFYTPMFLRFGLNECKVRLRGIQ